MRKNVIAAIVCIALVAVFSYIGYSQLDVYDAGQSGLRYKPYVVPALTQVYTNDVHRFSLMMPADFTVREMLIDDGTTLVFEDAHANGIQISIVPFDEDLKVLTKERIERDVPDMKIDDVQSVEVGDEYRGLAFKSDNPDYGGASREVWFVFRGTLYQISTYERLDPLLQAIFATWKFF